MYESINEHLSAHFYHNETIRQLLKKAEATVLAGEKTSFTAAQDLLDTYFNDLKG